MPYELFHHTAAEPPWTLAEQRADPPNPLDGSTLYAKVLAGRRLPRFNARGGMGSFLQPNFGTQKVAFWSAPGNSTTLPIAFGSNGLTTTGTATIRNVASTNMLTRCRRLGYVSSVSAGSATGPRQTVAQWTVGDGAGLGGFFFAAIFNISDASILAAGRTFVGLDDTTTAPTDSDPLGLTNALGIAANSAHTSFRLFGSGPGNGQVVILDDNFPCDTTDTDLYRLCLYSSPWEKGVVYYEVTRLNTGDVATGRLSGELGIDLPASTTLLTFNSYRSNGGNATAVGIDFSLIYIEGMG